MTLERKTKTFLLQCSAHRICGNGLLIPLCLTGPWIRNMGSQRLTLSSNGPYIKRLLTRPPCFDYTAGIPTAYTVDGSVAGSLGCVRASRQEARVAVSAVLSFLH